MGIKGYKPDLRCPTPHVPRNAGETTDNTGLVSKVVQGLDGSLGSICHFAQGDIHGETMECVYLSVKLYLCIVFGT